MGRPVEVEVFIAAAVQVERLEEITPLHCQIRAGIAGGASEGAAGLALEGAAIILALQKMGKARLAYACLLTKRIELMKYSDAGEAGVARNAAD